ncbi:nicotianamine synthase family protein [Jidongwangia harbinensis]|uniref:nicotianamine synthase family protein n=1 Tax=Jidongwangia harbinensis TaxID=2878561 RepID=UPI001CD95D6A|nr:nicotianamine synthase family protein [Jidongwangia harbinensis]MCA2216935.1 hypothetical protein [Jidongwangia harbinensis]
MLSASAAPARDADNQVLAGRILRLYDGLRAQDSLAPSPVVNSLFADLVATCAHADPVDVSSVLTDPRIAEARDNLVRLCAVGESQLEDWWARRTLAAPDPHAELAAFPYLRNYEQLAHLERHALAGTGHRPGDSGRLCFIGGGPLPLSAIMLSRMLRTTVTVVDQDADAVELSRRLIGRLGLADRISVLLADARSASDLACAAAGCDVVVVAALVGTTRVQKQAALRAVGTSIEAGTRVAVRSANGLRSLLYPVVSVRDVRDAGLVPEVLLHPFGEVINSVLVARRH